MLRLIVHTCSDHDALGTARTLCAARQVQCEFCKERTWCVITSVSVQLEEENDMCPLFLATLCFDCIRKTTISLTNVHVRQLLTRAFAAALRRSREESQQQNTATRTPSEFATCTPDLSVAGVRELLKLKPGKLEAVKIVKAFTGMTLMESKRLVEQVLAESNGRH